jgi:membrane protease YdiL (CAAX protease family)
VPSPQDPDFYAPGDPGPPPPFIAQESAYGDENPGWTGWDVLGLTIVTLLSIFVLLFATTAVAQRLLFPGLSIAEVAKFPLVTVAAQMLAYILVFAFMVAIVRRGERSPFWKSTRWNWPHAWLVYLGTGAVLAIALQGLAHFLPMPKGLPIDRFFETSREAWVLSIFGVTIAPLMEELFFRGFLYPVLVRRLGAVSAIILTAAGFGLIHAPQLGKAWAPVLVVFLVGLVLTITRAVTKSVAAGFLIHIAYNGTISTLLFLASSGFRHLDRLNP